MIKLCEKIIFLGSDLMESVCPLIGFFLWFGFVGFIIYSSHRGTVKKLEGIARRVGLQVIPRGFLRSPIITGVYKGFPCEINSERDGGRGISINMTLPVSENFYVWYKVDGMGTDPAVPARIGIQVDIASTDTAAQVATKTQIAINMQYFAVPDYRGLFLRGYSGTNAFNDPQADIRASVVPGVVGNEIGTFQFDDILSHFHGYDSNNYVNPGSSGGASAETVLAADTDPAGGYESRPKNMAINFAIIY